MASPAGLATATAAAATAAAAAAATTCPAYPWPQDGARSGGGKKVFMQSDCAACHSMLPYAGLRAAAAEVVGPQAAEIVVAEEQARPPARPLHGGAYTPELTALVAKARVQQGLRHDLYAAGGATAAALLADGAAVCQKLKKKMVWLQLVQPYVNTFQAD